MSIAVGGVATVRSLITLMEQLLSTPTSGMTYQLTVDTAPIPLSTQPFSVKTVIVKADDDNAGSIFVGFDNTVSPTSGFRLTAGQGLELLIDDLSKVWVVANSTGQKLHVLVLYSGTSPGSLVLNG